MSQPTVTGTGYLTLDVIIEGMKDIPSKVQAGGSFGNVLTILAFLGTKSFPIARLNDNLVSNFILNDLKFWGVNLEFVSKEKTGTSPVLIHRVLSDKNGNAKHRFEFKNPVNGEKFPSFRPFLKANIDLIKTKLPKANVFYFDRVNRSAITLAKIAKSRGSIVFFEPSSNSYSSLFEECLNVADVIKFSNERLPEYKFRYRKQRGKLEIETDGQKGLNYRTIKTRWKSLKPTQISKVVDTVGAGDWCSAGIIKVISQSNKVDFTNIDFLEKALNFGQAIGGINCMFLGARGAMYNLPSHFYSKLQRDLEFDSYTNYIHKKSKNPKFSCAISNDQILQMIS